MVCVPRPGEPRFPPLTGRMITEAPSQGSVRMKSVYISSPGRGLEKDDCPGRAEPPLGRSV